MDEMVLAAMAKWPQVPAVYGFLQLDARGAWRVGGEPITHPALSAFLSRNYVFDAGPCYVQNGPQRVFVTLALAPRVLRRQPDGWLALPDGDTPQIQALYFTAEGEVYAACAQTLALVDGRDVGALLAEALPDWDGDAGTLPATCTLDGAQLAIAWQSLPALLARFGVCLAPAPAAGEQAAVVSSAL